MGWDPLQRSAKFYANDLNIFIYSNTWGYLIGGLISIYQKSNIYRLRHCHHFISSFTHSVRVFLHLTTLFSPAPPHFYRSTPNHPQSYAPDAQTISICHVSPHQLHSEYPKVCIHNLSMLPIPQRHSTHPPRHHMPSYHLFSSLQAMQIPSLHCPCLSPICKHTLITSSINLFFYVIWCATCAPAVRMRVSPSTSHSDSSCILYTSFCPKSHQKSRTSPRTSSKIKILGKTSLRFSLRFSMRISTRSCPRSWFLMKFLMRFLILNN